MGKKRKKMNGLKNISRKIIGIIEGRKLKMKTEYLQQLVLLKGKIKQESSTIRKQNFEDKRDTEHTILINGFNGYLKIDKID